MAARLRLLREHLAAGAARPFAWGECDCSLFAADWVLAATGRDPARAWRGRYRTARGARRLIVRAGGLEALARRAMAEAGFAETRDPRPGDVGVVAAPTGPVLAILTPLGWSGKAPEGVAIARFPVLAAWSVA